MKARGKKGGTVAKPGVPGMKTMKEAAAPAHGFAEGGAIPPATTKLKDGGTVPGFKAGGRLDRAPRGNGMRGRSPFSSASKVSGPG